MPTPDYPFGAWIDGCPRRNRPALCHVRAAIFHHVPLVQPEDVPDLWERTGLGCHYVVTVTGGVFQCCPERQMVLHCDPAPKHAVPDRASLAIWLQDHPDHPAFPPEQIHSLARVITVSWANTGRYRLVDAANNVHARNAPRPLQRFPWLALMALIDEDGSPFARIKRAAERAEGYDAKHATAVATNYAARD